MECFVKNCYILVGRTGWLPNDVKGGKGSRLSQLPIPPPLASPTQAPAVYLSPALRLKNWLPMMQAKVGPTRAPASGSSLRPPDQRSMSYKYTHIQAKNIHKERQRYEKQLFFWFDLITPWQVCY